VAWWPAGVSRILARVVTADERTGDRGGPGGAPLAYSITGTGTVVVCLHGQPGSSADWLAVAEALAAEFSVVAVDRPGYGRTGGEAAGFGGNAAAVLATLDELGIDRAIVVGHSWAGGVALTLAADHPERVRGLVLVSSIGPVSGPGWLDQLLAAPFLGDVLVASTFALARTLLGSAAVRTRLDRVVPGLSSRALTTPRGPVWRSFMVEQRAYVDGIGDVVTVLAHISVPTVVVTGMSDHVVTPEVADRLASAIPGAILRQVAGAGHLLPFDHPREVADAVRVVSGQARSL
jgi:pimeloyl-ACP methyl ester carboxylesterase